MCGIAQYNAGHWPILAFIILAFCLKQNHLLAVLPEPDLERWTTLLEVVDLPLGKVLYESGTTQRHVYFPTTSIVSLLYVLENGASAEIAVVGNEGVVGISLFMGGAPRPAVLWYKVRARAFA
jgi:CRP-like cAMP-binding protein